VKPSSHGCAVLTAALLLAGCGQQPEVVQAAASMSPNDLRNVDWQLQSLTTTAGGPKDLEGSDAVLRVSADDHVSGHGCNFWGGAGDVGPGSLQVSQIGSTLIGCSGVEGDIDGITQELLKSGGSWSIDDDVLTLSGGGTTLTYRPRPTPWSNPSATTLAEGAFGEAIYRLSWQYNADNDVIGVEWQSRDRPGVGLGSSGIGRSATEDITYLDPSGATVAGRGFVYVPAPLTVDRVVWAGTKGEVELTRHALPNARTWHLFAGFVNGPTKGGKAIGYSGRDAVMQSRVLPY
jgi:heat shock protein HslJ